MKEEALKKLAEEIDKVHKVIYGDFPKYSYFPKKEPKTFEYWIKDIQFLGQGRKGYIYAQLYHKDGSISISADLPYILNKFGGYSRKVRNYKYYVVACIVFQEAIIDLLKGRRPLPSVRTKKVKESKAEVL